MLRWAHRATSTRNLDHLAQQATFRLGKLQQELDSAIQRYQRLAVDDEFSFANLTPQDRPSSMSRRSGGTLYVEIKDIPPQSAIRSDDLEVYMRHTAYSLKINKLVNKFIARLKWVALTQRFDIYDAAVTAYFDLRRVNLREQENLLTSITKFVEATTIPSKQIKKEIEAIRRHSHVEQYNKTMFNNRVKLIGACRPDYEVAPDLVTNMPEMKVKIKSMAEQFGLTADLTQDNGFSFAYQLSLVFPTYFQRQIIKSSFTIYDAFAYDAQASVPTTNLVSMVRVDPSIFRDVSTTSALLPSEESLAEEVLKQNLKVIRLKAAPWVESVVCEPTPSDWMRAQMCILYSEENPIDTLLRGALDFLDVNDLASVNMAIQEVSQMHIDLLTRQHLYHEQAKMSKISAKVEQLGSQDKPEVLPRHARKEETVWQTVSATSIQEVYNNMYMQMSNALTGNAFRSSKLTDLNKTNTPKPAKTSLFSLPLHLVQTFNTLRCMQSRDNKLKIIYTLNYFRAVQKRLMLDLREFGTRERVLGDVVPPIKPPEEADQKLVDNLNLLLSTNAAKHRNLSFRKERVDILTESTVEDINKKNNDAGVSLIDVKKIRYKGRFHHMRLSTCPVLPKLHAAYGEPVEI